MQIMTSAWFSFLHKPRAELKPSNSPFPSCLKPFYQSEAWCTTIHMKMSLIYMWMKSHFHMKRWAPRLALRKRLKVIRKWPIGKANQPLYEKILDLAFVHKILKSIMIKMPSQSPPLSMTSKWLILHGEARSYCFTISCVPESFF